tara:strand:+ start:670 stop:2124 length:1455 start_codon:yes stop_codon:yes gene_type:complete
MTDLLSRANVNIAINTLLDDLQPNDAIQPSDHNGLLKDILDTLSNGLSTTLRTGNTTDGQNMTITSSSIFQFENGSNGRLQSGSLTAFRNWTLPDKNGTVAMLSDITGGDNLGTADLTQTNLSRSYNRSAIAGISRLRFRGTNQLFQWEDGGVMQFYAGDSDTVGAIPSVSIYGSGASVGNINFRNGGATIKTVGNDLVLKGQASGTIPTFIELGINIVFNVTSPAWATWFKSNKVNFKSNDSSTFYGSMDTGVFVWSTQTTAPAPIGNEKFSIQENTLIKGSNNASGTSGFKVTDINDVSLLDVKNSGNVSMGGAIQQDLTLNITGSTNDNTKGTLRCNDLAGNKMFSVDNAGNIEAPTTGLINFGGANITPATGLFKLAVRSDLPLLLRKANDSKLVSFAHDGCRFTGKVKFGSDSFPGATVDIKGENTTSIGLSLKVTNSANTSLLEVKNNGQINASSLPTSSAGLSSGDIWNNSGVLNIV